MNQTLSGPLTLRQRLYAHLSLARISNSPTVASNTLAGAALTGSLAFEPALLLVGLAMVLFYTAGMYLNDLCDYAIDCKVRPERPLPRGLVSKTTVLGVVIGLFVLGSLALLAVGWGPLGCGLLLIGFIYLYDSWHKGNAVSPLIMACCRVLVYVTAWAAFVKSSSAPLFPNVIIPCGLLLLYVAGLTYVAKSEDKPQAIRFGLVAIIFLPALYFPLAQWSWLVLPLALLFAGWTAYSLTFVFNPQKRQIGRAVGQLIAGISLLDSLVLAGVSVIGASLAVVAFGLTLFLQRYVKGT